MNLEYLDI